MVQIIEYKGSYNVHTASHVQCLVGMKFIANVLDHPSTRVTELAKQDVFCMHH